MSDDQRELFQASHGAVRFLLTNAAGMDEEEADTVITGLLDSMAGMLAEKVQSDPGHIRYGAACDYAERHAALIRDWRK